MKSIQSSMTELSTDRELIVLGKIYILKDVETSEIYYVGSTKRELNVRKGEHNCDSRKSVFRQMKNDNISMRKNVTIAELESCINTERTHLLEREQHWINLLSPKYNKHRATAELYECELCHFLTTNQTRKREHIQTQKHINNTNPEYNQVTEYHCINCDYHTNRKNNMNRHKQSWRCIKNYIDNECFNSD
jgi:hypothetical protein